jgi:hypothetical protein
VTAVQLDLATLLKEQGQARASAVQPQDWKDRVDAEISRRARQGDPFTADDVSAVVGDSPTGSQGAMGARFSHAARRGVIRRVGYVPSKRASVHGHPVAEWRGVAA